MTFRTLLLTERENFCLHGPGHDGVANANDLTWSHTFMVTANIVFYLPSTASISP